MMDYRQNPHVEIIRQCAAAVAAGMELWMDSVAGYRNGPHGDTWNPLTDDGDALRLAVKLNMTLAAGMARSDAGEFLEFEMCATDPCAATRRAIVRAAAQIGRSKE